jgi:hypothetical protein
MGLSLRNGVRGSSKRTLRVNGVTLGLWIIK